MNEAQTAAYAAAQTGAAVIVRGDRRFVRVHGREPVKMIHGLVTNDVQNATAERAVYAALLTPKGRMLGDLRVLRFDAELLLELDADSVDGVLAHLKKFVPPLFAKFEDASASYAMLGVYGPTSHDIITRVLGVTGEARAVDEVAVVAHGERMVRAIGSDYAGVPGYELLVARDDAARIEAELRAAGAVSLDADTLDVLRIEAGVPRWGAELDENVIPLEAGLKERAISTTKGCYTGQEVIIRILHRGHVNWELRGLLLGDASLPARGDTLHRAGESKSVARVTSACRSPRMAQTIALAYVRREIGPGTELQLGNHAGAAEVVMLPFRA